MYDVYYRSLLSGNQESTYTKMNTSSNAYYFEVLFSNEQRMTLRIQALMDAVDNELHFIWNTRSNFTLDEKLLIEEAYDWVNKEGKLLKGSLINMLSFGFHERALYVLEQSLERLMEHFKRKQQLWRNGSNTEIYIEWLLELPYLMKERLESASAQSALQNPIIHHEKRKNNSTPAYRRSMELEESRASGIELALCC